MNISEQMYVAYNDTVPAIGLKKGPAKKPLAREVCPLMPECEMKTAKGAMTADPCDVARIIHAVAIVTKVAKKDLLGAGRTAPISRARHLAWYVIYRHTDFSYPAIAAEFGRKDHTTVMSAYRKWSREKIHFTQNKRQYHAVLDRLGITPPGHEDTRLKAKG